LKLDSPLHYIKGVGEKYLQIFSNQGMHNVFDLLLHFPIHYLDLTHISRTVKMNQSELYQLQVKNYKLTRNFKKRISVLKVNTLLGEKNLTIVIFNQPYFRDFFKKNKKIFIYGKVEKRENIFQTINPLLFAEIGKYKIIPVYRNISSMKSGRLRRIMENIFDSLNDDFEFLPECVVKKHSFLKIDKSLRMIHFPEKIDENQSYSIKKRFIYGEFFLFQTELQYIRNHFKKIKRINHYVVDAKVRNTIKKRLFFDLTPDQVRAFSDIVNDLKKDFTMQRLLQGDVGVGKTIIAFLSLLLSIENGYQCAFLVPTEILAKQHFINAKDFFKGFSIEILTGSATKKEKDEIKNRINKGDIDLIFGTHALLSENLKFKKLAMIVIDEQHRFGVSQRAALFYKGKAVDLLVMTATPIPRTMLLTLFNDLGVSIIKTKPLGRKSIKTKIIDIKKRGKFYIWLKEKIKRGEKGYIVLPLIEKSNFFPHLRSIEEDSEYLKSIFSPLRVEIISGKTPAKKKEKILTNFRSGEIRLLISTTVIEVGIDVKDSTIMVIENADKYGLAQLHQLRGRVGRGEQQSFCYLQSSENITDNGKKRLQTIVSTDDGFQIAETDLDMRGGGIVSGFEQSGFFDFKVADIKNDFSIFTSARNDVIEILKDNSYQSEYILNFLSEMDKKIEMISFS